ncbi:NUDIX hydrolase [Nocardia sp. NPDC060259]|uniref:NUDIX hydrolase n=1 Tax=Nocardia sp. NPDC060259 TaxID=3347088 RepID=UPI00365566BE
MTAVGFTEVDWLRLKAAEPPRADPAVTTEVDEYWTHRVLDNPTLFNGPLVAAAGIRFEEAGCDLQWFRSDYAHYLWRQAPGSSEHRPYARTIYVATVARTENGGILVGRMADTTSSPGRIQLPGGNAEPPNDEEFVEGTLRNHAIREFAEEVGMPPPAIRLWAVKTGGVGDIGVVYSTNVCTTDAAAAFSRVRAEQAKHSEFAAVLELVPSPSGKTVSEPVVDYLPVLLDTLFGTQRVAVRELEASVAARV